MKVIRIPTKYSRSIRRLPEKSKLQLLDLILKIWDDEQIYVPDNDIWDLISLIYWDWMNMESKNWEKLLCNHLAGNPEQLCGWLGRDTAGYSGAIVKESIRKDSIVKHSTETTSIEVVREISDLEKLLIEFKKSRAKLKRPMTDKAMELLLKKLSDYSEEEQIAMLEEAIEKWWQSVYPKKEEDRNGKNVARMEAIANYNFT